MTKVLGTDIRDPEGDEPYVRPEKLAIKDYMLSPTGIKIFKPSGAPVHFFEILSPDGTKIGRASAILEPDTEKVKHVGQVCVTVAESHSSAQLMAEVGLCLARHCKEHGVSTIRFVVPKKAAAAVDACKIAGAIETGELISDKAGDMVALELKL